MNPYDAYRSATKLSMSDREIEAAVLTKAANQLQACQENWGASGHKENLGEALRFNQRLWSIFQVELAKPDHPLPAGLRRDILSLGAFIDNRIFDVMADPAAEKLTVIITISRNLAAGLWEGGAPKTADFVPYQRDVSETENTGVVWA